MDNKIISHNAIQKCKSRENETPEYHKTRIAKQCEKNRQKKAVKTTEEWDVHYANDRKQKWLKLAIETNEQHESRLENNRLRKKAIRIMMSQQVQAKEPQQVQAKELQQV